MNLPNIPGAAVALSQSPAPCVAHGAAPCLPCFLQSIDGQKRAEISQIAAGIVADRTAELIDRANIPARFAAASLAHLPADKATKLRTWAAAAAAGSPGALILMGPVGTGKTYAACGLLRALAELGVRGEYVRTADVARRAKAAWDERGTSELAVMQALAGPRVLVLDELGLGATSEADAQRIHMLIDDRYSAGLPIIACSNLDGPSLREALGDRTYDRLRDGATKVDFKGASRREPL